MRDMRSLSSFLLGLSVTCASSNRSPRAEGEGEKHVSARDCTSICEGLECEKHPYTCVLVEELYGCHCEHSRTSRRLASNSSSVFDCTYTCLGTCDPSTGPDCDIFANLGAKCSELETDTLWDINLETCDCTNSACENEDTVYETVRDDCPVWSSTSVNTEVELRDALLQSCQTITILNDIQLSQGHIVISSQTRSRIVGNLNEEAPRIKAAQSSRAIFMEPSAWLEMKHVKIEDGAESSFGGCIAVGASSTFIGDDIQVTNCTSGLIGGAFLGWSGANIELKGGSFIANSTSTYGAGAYVRDDATIRLSDDSLIDSCISWETGGGIAATNGRVILDSSHIRRSTGHLSGGGGIALLFDAHLDMSNGSSIVDCSALGIGIGGSIMGMEAGTVLLTTGATIRRSYALSLGGAIFTFGEVDLVMTGRSSVVDSFAGSGCVYNNRGTSGLTERGSGVIFEDSSIERCTSFYEEHAGAFHTIRNANLINFKIRDSSSIGNGAGMSALNAIVSVEDSDISGCSCYGRGCAFTASGSVVSVVNTRIWNVTSMSFFAGNSGASQALSGAAFYFGENTRSFISRVNVSNAHSSTHAGGGLAISGGSVAHVDACNFINCSAGSSGGAVAIDGGVAFVTGKSTFKFNVATRGGAISVSGGSNSRLYASGSCWFTVMTLDWTLSDISTSRATGIWIQSAFNQDSVTSTVDARGTLMWTRPTPGEKVEHAYCFDEGSYELWMAQADVNGWEGGTWDFSHIPPGIELADDFRSLKQYIDVGDYADLGAEFSVRSELTRGRLLFESNYALESGGAIFAAEESKSYLHNIDFGANVAAQNGGAIALGLLSNLEVSECSYDANSASDDGGALHIGHLSSSKLRDIEARSNVAGDLGGFAIFDRIQEVIVTSATVTGNRATLGGGIAVKDCDYEHAVIKDVLFEGNNAVDAGGALWSSESEVEISTSQFYNNSAHFGSGGAVSVDPGKSLTFVPSDACTTVQLFVDWRQTTERCTIDDPANPLSFSCDTAVNVCERTRARNPSRTPCRGCSCPLDTAEGAENYVRMSGSAVEEDQYALPMATALAVFEYCLPPGNFEISAHNALGGGWYGGTVFVIVAGEVVVDDLNWEEGGFRSLTQTFTVSVEPVLTQNSSFFDNEALQGGGGAVFWSGSTPPGNIEDVQAANNSANYGDFQAGPAVAIAILKNGALNMDASNATFYSAASGHPLADQLVVHLLDESNQLVTSEVGRTAIVRAVGADDASVSNNLAEFIGGVATFTYLFVTHMPNVTLNAVVESDISTLRVADLPLVFDFRACLQNEYEDERVCKECEAGMYLDTDGICKMCFHGVDCTEPGRRLEALTNVRGFWRPSRRATEVYRCPYANACPATESVGADACRGEDYIGPLCSVCRAGSYENFKHRCIKCEQKSAVVAGLFLSFVLILLAVVLSVVFTKRGSRFLRSFVSPQSTANESTSHENEEHSGTYLVKLKLMMTFWQIITNMTYIFSNLRLPAAYALVSRAVSVVVNLAFLGGFPARCFSSSSPSQFYVQGLVAKTTFPICLAAIFCSIAMIRSRIEPKYAKQYWHFCFESILLLIHFVLSTTSTAGFRAFVCDSYKSGGGREHRFLRVEPTISCSSKLWRRFVAPYGALCVLIYAAGIPLLYASLLFAHRKQLSAKHHNHGIRIDGIGVSSKQLMTSSMRRVIELSPSHQQKLDKLRRAEIRKDERQDAMLFRFLWLDYSCRCYYFEVVEAVRRILLTAGISVVRPGSVMQINIGLILATFFSAVIISMKPYVQPSDNVLAITAQVATALTLYVMLLLKIELVGHMTVNVLLLSLALLPFTIALLAIRQTLFVYSGNKTKNKLLPLDERAVAYVLPKAPEVTGDSSDPEIEDRREKSESLTHVVDLQQAENTQCDAQIDEDECNSPEKVSPS